MAKCSKCGKITRDDVEVNISGTASVEGDTSIRAFRNVGVEWYAKDSWDEKWKCPYCGGYTNL